jgi:carboxylesterase type B
LNLFITRPSAEALAAAGFDVVNRKLPVYVYIHGGAYGFGAGTDPMWGKKKSYTSLFFEGFVTDSYADPSRLVSKSISLGTPFIVATVNYRLNTFGFAASTDIINIQSDGQKKGCNFGLGDQRTALEWVQQNIGPFGGDANQVTVGGQSAGGSSSHAHVLQAILGKGKPLCQRGIIQSGAVGVLGPVNLSTADARWSAYCTQLGAPENDLAARMAFMTKVPAAEILRANKKQEYWAFPLVVDNLTISQRPNGRWIVHLDQGHENTTEGGSNKHTDAIDVLIGDTDLEVSYTNIS